MSRSFVLSGNIEPSRTESAYILALALTYGNGLAAITSANELLIADRQKLNNDPIRFQQDVPSGTSCLISAQDNGQTILCSGTDGSVAMFDIRTQSKVSGFQIDRAVTALAVSGTRIALGTEFKSQSAIVSCWDIRQSRRLWQNTENNDEITVVNFHPTRSDTLLAGGDDGLVSLFDTTIVEEDDSLKQVINHGPIYKAGFLGESRVFALSSDQHFAVHPVSTPDDAQDPAPSLIGDLRPIVPCQYVIDVLRNGPEFVIATGSNIDQSRIDLVDLVNATNLFAQPHVESATKVTIEPAHGEEVVRAIVMDEQAGAIFTAGEDGYIRAFKATELSSNNKSVKSTKHKKAPDGRYKPY